MDTDKVIKGLNDIGSFIAGRLGFEQARNFLRTIDDALAVLKEQEAVTPTRMYHSERAGFDNYLCECKNELYYKQKFCDECGRVVKWE